MTTLNPSAVALRILDQHGRGEEIHTTLDPAADFLDAPRSSEAGNGSASSGAVLLLDRDYNPLYANSEAVRILLYPDAPDDPLAVQRLIRHRIQTMLIENGSHGRSQISPKYVSGRRRYLCRTFTVEQFPDAPASTVHHVLLFERPRKRPIDIGEIAMRYRLSHRESETVELLACGLSGKEIANRMNVSPNTVKSFVRVIMAKVGVSSRSGLIRQIFEWV